MIKLLDILKEIAEETPTPEEQKVIDDLLGSLDEGAFDTLLAKAKKYAKKGLMTATVLAALMATPTLTDAQKTQVKDVAKDTSTLVKYGKTQARSITLDQRVLDEWNSMQSWLKSKGLLGDPKLDRADFNAKVMAEYEKEHPGTIITDPEVVKTIQSSIVDHRNGTIAGDEAGTIDLADGAYEGTDYSGYLPHVLKIDQKAQRDGDYDGFIGQYTSKVVIPKDLRSNPTGKYAPTPVLKNK